MTHADLARIAAAIDADSAIEAANWPLSRERARAYMELARAVAGLHVRREWWEDYETGGCCHCTSWTRKGETGVNHRPDCPAMRLDAALAALAPDADAGEGGT